MNADKLYRRVVIALCLVVIAWFGYLISIKVNFAIADLGRHITNGEVLVHGTAAERHAIIYENWYSYTNPTFPFVNHHWLAGIIFYLVYAAVGFVGVSVFFSIIATATFVVFFLLALRKARPIAVVMSAALFMPLMVYRNEIRPEIVSSLFAGLYTLLLTLYYEGKLKTRWLYAIPVMGLLWVNLHIGFIFGIAIIGLFWLYELSHGKQLSRERLKTLSIILGLTVVATCINPHGLYGAVYPFLIFSNYGYIVYENQSIAAIENFGYPSPLFVYYKLLFCAVFIILGVFVLKRKAWKELRLPLFTLAILFFILSLNAVRSMSLAGFFMMPLIAYVLDYFLTRLTDKKRVELIIGGGLLAIICVVFQTFVHDKFLEHGWGLARGVNDSATFFKENNIKGPIFNNYDNGGYLIFHLHDREKVFVDNRPEAYPKTFFDTVYIPPQMKPEDWKTFQEQYKINTIFWYPADITVWSRRFLYNRIMDPEWAPVFLNNYGLIFVRRVPENQEIIKKYELPKSTFGL